MPVREKNSLPPAAPVSHDEFAGFMAALEPWPEALTCAVAVSGGPDSLALAFLLQEWANARGARLLAFIVDHQLRADSRKTAEAAAAALHHLGLEPEILTWRHHTLPKTAIHAQARAARYELLLDACRCKGATHLFLAHHADDQGETVLIRFARGSALDGLSAMPSLREQDGIVLARPLLPLRKNRLVATCRAHELEFATDPANASPQFTRGRLREVRDILALEGLTPERLYEFARNTGMARAHLEALTNIFFEQHGGHDAFGAVHFSHEAWRAQTQDARARILTRGLLCASGEDYAPRSESLHRLAEALQKDDYRDQTLSGCLVRKDESTITILREEAMVQDVQDLHDADAYLRWDRRFVIGFARDAAEEGLHVRKLGHVGRAALETRGLDEVAALPAAARASLPALYRGQDFAGMPAFFPVSPEESLVTARFLPRRSLIVKPFQPPPPLAD